jgi:hypothetical protein
MDTRLLRQLKAVDWDFPRPDSDAIGAIHWYPGTFPPQIPGTLIEALSAPDHLIIDPYGGVGTTAVEALRMGRRAWSIDQNPIACLSAYVLGGLVLLKSVQTERPESLLVEVERFVNRQVVQPDLFLYAAPIDCDEILLSLCSPSPSNMLSTIIDRTPRWKLLSRWFHASTLLAIRRLHNKLLESETSAFGKLVGLLMMSACLRPASSQNKSWGHIADNVFPEELTEKDLLNLCKRWIDRVRGGLSRVKTTTLSNKARATRFWISNHDWRCETKPNITPTSLANLLVSSPPYAGAIDYTRAQRLSLYLLGFNEAQIDRMGSSEIGARRKRMKPDSEESWGHELASALHNQLECVYPNAPVALVLPHEDHGREIGSIKLAEVLECSGRNRIYVVDRSIRQGRTRQSWTSIKKETIEVYEAIS